MNWFRFYEVVPVFCWTWTLVIILLHSLISPIISILTFFKVIFFTGTVSDYTRLFYDKCLFFIFIFKVLLTFAVGVQNPIPVVTDFSATGDSFLMGLVALGRKSC
jgi:hypothetical protein